MRDETQCNVDLELPVRCVLEWASAATRMEIQSLLSDRGRQTMNLRVMTTARLIVLRNFVDDAIIGFAGVDDEYLPGYPELFSLHVEPAYRALGLGTLLETARAEYLIERGHVVGYTRMEQATNYKLLGYRVRSRAFAVVPRATLAPAYAGLCSACELYGNECTQQAFMMVDLALLRQRGIARFGEIELLPRLNASPDEFPPLEISPSTIAPPAREERAPDSQAWAAAARAS